MDDAVLRVRGHLQSLARENWSALEGRHARNVTWLRDELAQISRSLEVKARFEQPVPVAAAPFPRSLEVVLDVAGPARKKQKTQARPGNTVDWHREDSSRTRLSMRLRTRSESVEVADGGTRRASRKRSRPSEALLQDPGKLKVVQLRSELKKRGLRTSGLKAVLFDRLLDALEEEQKEDGGHLKKVQESDAEEEGGKQRQGDKPAVEVIVIDDDDDDDIVRESVGSYKSPGSFLRSQSTSPKAVMATEDNAKCDGESACEEVLEMAEDAARRLPPQLEDSDAVMRTGRVADTIMEAPDTASEAHSAKLSHQSLLSETATARTSHESAHFEIDFATAGGAEELINHDVVKMTRKSMQVSGKSELSSPLAWKRKSILRKASSLAPSTRGPSRNVSFAPIDKVDIIVESSQTDSTQPDPSPEKTLSSIDPDSPRGEMKSARLDSTPEADTVEKTKTVSPHVVPSTTPSLLADPPLPAMPASETEEQRKKREFDENVQHEAEKLRRAIKLSAQKRLEEAKASKAFWAKRDQLKAKLRASSADNKRKSAHTPVSSEKSAVNDHLSPPTTELPTATESVSSASDTNRLTSSTSQEEVRAQYVTAMASMDIDEAKDRDFVRSMARYQDVEDISNVSSAFESLLHEHKAPRATYSVVEEKQQVERATSHRLVDKPAAKSIQATVSLPKQSTSNHTARMDVDKLTEEELQRMTHEPPFLSSATTSHEFMSTAHKPNLPMMQAVEPLTQRDRSDSLSSTVSSIPEPSVVENALKSGTSTDANSGRRPILNLVGGIHSFTTLLEKGSSQESNSGRSAPVVNSLKLAERSRVLEEKKRLEKEKRKAILKKKMEEHKKIAALKEKAEKDAQAKREQDRLNERKKREAELARKRQQKLKEMRAGLEKKRALLAAEKKAGHTPSAAMTSKSAASAASHHKHRGLASASETSQPTAKPTAKPMQKPVPKPMPKLVSKLAPVSKPVSKPVHKSVLTSPAPAKHAPKSHSPEMVNYEMSDNAESSGGDSSDSDSERHGKKKVPRWAQKDHLNKILHAQFGKNAVDPSPAIFQDFVDTCNLEAIFETTDVRKKKKFARRTSSGNWLADRPTARDKALYQRDMGYDQ